ncbi:MAG: nitronate monooxygenase, partial [Clostridia bacterium]
RKPVLHNNIGGYSGKGVFPVALRMVWQVANTVKIPVIGLGGIETTDDALQMLLAGASAIQIGTAMFTNPYTPIKIVREINDYLDQNNIKWIYDIIGKVTPYSI